MTNTEVKAGQFETDEIHRTITFSLIIITDSDSSEWNNTGQKA